MLIFIIEASIIASVFSETLNGTASSRGSSKMLPSGVFFDIVILEPRTPERDTPLGIHFCVIRS